jgi:monoterpene epsilon-lactone hydrolase
VDVSDVFRDSLLKAPTPDVEAAKSIVFETTEQWEAWIRERDAKTAVAARQLATALSVTVQHDTISGVNVYHVTPPEIASEHKRHLFVHVHGGAYVVGGGEAGTFEAVLIASHLKMPVISIDYRMPPKYPAPAAMEDVVAVWKQLLKDRPAASMAMGGSSAGAGLTMTSVQRFKELGLELPQALLLGTPGADVDKVGDSRYINEGIDQNLVAWDGVPFDALKMYAGECDLKHPYVSPVYGDFAGFPPSYLISGTRDLMLSDTVRVHRKLRRAGVEADLHIYEGQSHADYLKVLNAPESYEHFAELNAFLLKHLQSPLLPVSPPPADPSKDIEIPKSVTY